MLLASCFGRHTLHERLFYPPWIVAWGEGTNLFEHGGPYKKTGPAKNPAPRDRSIPCHLLTGLTFFIIGMREFIISLQSMCFALRRISDFIWSAYWKMSLSPPFSLLDQLRELSIFKHRVFVGIPIFICPVL